MSGLSPVRLELCPSWCWVKPNVCSQNAKQQYPHSFRSAEYLPSLLLPYYLSKLVDYTIVLVAPITYYLLLKHL